MDVWDRYRRLFVAVLQMKNNVRFMYSKSPFVCVTGATCLSLTTLVHNRAQYSEVLKVSDSTLPARFCPTDKTLCLHEFPLTVYSH